MTYKINRAGMAEVKALVNQAIREYAEDIRSVAEDIAPQGETGFLGQSFKTEHAEDQSIIFNDAPYASYVEFGTEPYNAKLITVDLVEEDVKRLGSNLRRCKFTNKPLVPVWFGWVKKVLNIPDDVDAYRISWKIYERVQREGFHPQLFFHTAVNEMRKEQQIKRVFGKYFEEVRVR